MTPPSPLFSTRRGRGPRLVLVHGFTQNRRCWGLVADQLAADHELVLLDAPGHGRSSHIRASFEQAARHIARSGGHAVYLGYSMGGRLCLHLALHHPELVRALVLVGATAGIEHAGRRRARRQADHRLADRIEAVGLAEFLEQWLGNPLFTNLPRDAAHIEERLDNTAEGLAASLRLAGTGAQQPLWDRLGELRAPTLAVAGQRDTAYAALARRLAASAGGPAEVALIPDAGHAAHLEQPDAFVDTLRGFLARHHL